MNQDVFTGAILESDYETAKNDLREMPLADLHQLCSYFNAAWNVCADVLEQRDPTPIPDRGHRIHGEQPVPPQ